MSPAADPVIVGIIRDVFVAFAFGSGVGMVFGHVLVWYLERRFRYMERDRK
jgi:hypothetical protein